MRFYGLNFAGTACVAGATLRGIRSTTPLTVGQFYYVGQTGSNCNVYLISSSKTPSGSDPIQYFDGSAGTCINAYNTCSGS
jgi:hypothetical protein